MRENVLKDSTILNMTVRSGDDPSWTVSPQVTSYIAGDRLPLFPLGTWIQAVLWVVPKNTTW